MTPPTPWSDLESPDSPSPTTAATLLPPTTDPDRDGTEPPTPAPETPTTDPTLLPPPAEPETADDEPAPTRPPTPDNKTHTADPALLPPPPEPEAADGGSAPTGPPAPDDEGRTGGAGGKPMAEGEAEAVAAQPAQRTAHRVRGLLLGLAAGDAAGWPAARHRAARMPDWTRRLTRELETFAEQNATTTLPVPIALNQPPEPLRLGPSDDAEWAAFTAEALLRAGDDTALGDLSRDRRVRAAIDLTWNAVAGEVAAAADRAPEIESAVLPLRARISVRAGLGNLATGLRPPATGHDNPHFFDDAACVRACVLAVAHPGDPRRAADLAEFDARYTQDGDGVLGARAMAAAVSLALTGAATGTCVAAALAELPAGTEIGRNARHAVDLAHAADGAFALVPLLEHQIVDHVYSYGVAAAETVPVALALAVAAGGRIAEAVPAAACLSRVADSAPALAGALTGALGGDACVPAAWRDTCRTLSGCALPRLTGTDLVELADLLEAAQPARPGG
ncbi:ADP-ribosylglycohydrolase family protein [Streptomyces sp. NPDC059805]|uniref:ADP-ribosylglycohydrolase family protein n=1 Tax=Streptomyces sp. NPDC059805 TaxID=3346954 RepID=UPI00364D2218